MRLKSLTVAAALCLALICFSLPAGHNATVSGQQRASPEDAVLFAVFGSTGAAGPTMEPFLVIADGKYQAPVAGDSDAAELTKFADTYYRPGRKYRLLSGGGEAGSLTVKKDTRDEECARTAAQVKLDAKLSLNRNVMAVATDSDSLGRAASSRRAPTPAERAAVLRLAKQTYTAKGVAASLLPTLETVNLTATDLDRDGKHEMVGSFVVKKSKGGAARFVLFLLAEPAGSEYKSVVTNYERYTNDDIMSGASLDAIGANGVYTERFLDQLDLDGDGAGEVVTLTNGFEGDTYRVYKRKGGKWSSVYEFAGYRCAF